MLKYHIKLIYFLSLRRTKFRLQLTNLHQTSSTTNAKGPTRKGPTKKPQTIKKMVIGTYISIITFNVNGLNAPTKRHRLAEWIQK